MQVRLSADPFSKLFLTISCARLLGWIDEKTSQICSEFKTSVIPSVTRIRPKMSNYFCENSSLILSLITK